MRRILQITFLIVGLFVLSGSSLFAQESKALRMTDDGLVLKTNLDVMPEYKVNIQSYMSEFNTKAEATEFFTRYFGMDLVQYEVDIEKKMLIVYLDLKNERCKTWDSARWANYLNTQVIEQNQ